MESHWERLSWTGKDGASLGMGGLAKQAKESSSCFLDQGA